MAEQIPSSKLPSHREDALTIISRLRESGHVAYFAGGCVRDMLLGLEPNDFDVATDAPPDRVRELFRNTQAVGAAFGVILVRQGKSVIEVATFRTDVSYEDGRRPTAVRFTSAEEDARRRDFTINGLFYDPIEEKVIDYVGGREDLEKKLLRAVGEAEHRFAEDQLRLLRAVRFAARFGLSIEPRTAAAIERHAQHLKRISPERIAEELRLMLTPATRNNADRMLREFGLDRIILRFIPDTIGHAGIFAEIGPQSISFGLALAGMVLDARGGQLPSCQEIRKASSALRQALKISNQECDQLEGSLGFARLLETSPTIAMLKRFLASAHANDARALMEATARARIMPERIHDITEQLSQLEKTNFAPPPVLTGHDLTAAGWMPGPIFKRVLDAVYDAQLEDKISTKPEAMTLADELQKRTAPDSRAH